MYEKAFINQHAVFVSWTILTSASLVWEKQQASVWREDWKRNPSYLWFVLIYFNFFHHFNIIQVLGLAAF